jgi:hypothetical protein
LWQTGFEHSGCAGKSKLTSVIEKGNLSSLACALSLNFNVYHHLMSYLSRIGRVYFHLCQNLGWFCQLANGIMDPDKEVVSIGQLVPDLSAVSPLFVPVLKNMGGR